MYCKEKKRKFVHILCNICISILDNKCNANIQLIYAMQNEL